MLRITRVEGEPGPTLILEGRLLGPWVAVLGDAARCACAGGATPILDLTQVTHVSHEGAEALCRLQGGGVRLVGASQLVESMCGAGTAVSARAAPAVMDAQDGDETP